MIEHHSARFVVPRPIPAPLLDRAAPFSPGSREHAGEGERTVYVRDEQCSSGPRR